MRDEFITASRANEASFGLALSDDTLARLADYYELVIEHNPILHLVGPCSPEEFATRHILESLTLLEYLPTEARFADVGPGAGLPSIPCLIARDDLHAVLIESKEKKAQFLRATFEACGLGERAEVIDRVDSSGGRVFVDGEYWNAVSDGTIEAGSTCEILAIRGLTLTVAGPESA